MTRSQAATDLRFEAPGPGFWELDAVHFPRPATRYWTEVHPEALRRGTQEFARSYGMLIGALEYAYVNGFAYRTLTPVRTTRRLGVSSARRRSSGRSIGESS
jgi:hypothetical protein